MANLVNSTSPNPPAAPASTSLLPFNLSGPFTAPWQAVLFLLLVAGIGVFAARNGTAGDIVIGILGVTVFVLIMNALSIFTPAKAA